MYKKDLFEQVIKSCKATNIEFTTLKKKIEICIYEEYYYTEEIPQTQDNSEKPLIKVTNNKWSNKSTNA